MTLADRMFVRRTALALLLMLVGALTLLPAGDVRASEERVEMSVVSFSPSTLEVATGTTVVWENTNLFNYPGIDGTHELEAEDGTFKSPPVAAGGSWAFRFLEPGTFPYRDLRHPHLRGEIVVVGEPVKSVTLEENVDIVEPDQNDAESWGYAPSDIVVTAGTKVTWRNTGSQVHTVTAEDGSFDSGDMAAGAVWSKTFDQPGAFRYQCTPHPWMVATVRVAAEGEAPPPPPPPPTPAAGDGSELDAVDAAAPPAGAGPQTIPVRIVEPQISAPKTWAFRPKVVAARTGDTVLWTNGGTIVHTVTASDGSFDSGDMAAKATFRRTFSSPGTFAYTCAPHPWMTGVVVVSDRPEAVDTDRIEVLGGGAGSGPQALGPSPVVSPQAGVALPTTTPSGSSSLPIAVAAEAFIVAMSAAWIAFPRARPTVR